MHADIIKRLEGLTGPDREVDAHILCALIAPAGSKVEKSPINGAWCIYEPRKYGPKPFSLWHTPHPWRLDHASPTASLDAAIALVERVLPGAYRASGKTALYPGMIPGSPPEKFFAHVGNWGEPTRSYHDCEPIALLIAMFRALSSRTQGGNDGSE